MLVKYRGKGKYRKEINKKHKIMFAMDVVLLFGLLSAWASDNKKQFSISSVARTPTDTFVVVTVIQMCMAVLTATGYMVVMVVTVAMFDTIYKTM